MNEKGRIPGRLSRSCRKTSEKEKKEEKKEKTTKKEVIYPSSQPEENIPRCPTCHSTKIKKIGAFERMASVGFWGPFSKKINKTFKCENCGYTW